MSRPDLVYQGSTFTYEFTLDGVGANAFTATMSVMQYPGDTPIISREVSYSCIDGDCGYIGTLTSAETASLSVGQWFIHVDAADSDENINESIKIYVRKGWV